MEREERVLHYENDYVKVTKEIDGLNLLWNGRPIKIKLEIIFKQNILGNETVIIDDEYEDAVCKPINIGSGELIKISYMDLIRNTFSGEIKANEMRVITYELVVDKNTWIYTPGTLGLSGRTIIRVLGEVERVLLDEEMFQLGRYAPECKEMLSLNITLGAGSYSSGKALSSQGLSGQGRLLELTIKIKNALPNIPIALGVLLMEKLEGETFKKGSKILRVVNTAENTCDIDVKLNFVLPDIISKESNLRVQVYTSYILRVVEDY